MTDEVVIVLLDADKTDVRKDENDEERRSLADDAAVVSELSVGTTAAEDIAKFRSFCFDTRK